MPNRNKKKGTSGTSPNTPAISLEESPLPQAGEKNPIPENVPPIIPFDPESGMKFGCWIQYFNKICQEQKLSEEFKFINISKFLKGTALKVYVNSYLACENFSELIELLNENFCSPIATSFSEYNKINFSGKTSELQNYFREKMEKGRILGLNNSLLLEGLTSGLPHRLRSLIIVKEPTNPTEWLSIVNKLTQAGDNEQTNHKSQFAPRHLQTSQERPPKHWRPYQPPIRQQYSARPTFHQQYQPRPQNVVHFQQRLPPSPCRYCETRGIFNAYHWGQQCIFKPENIIPKPNPGIDTDNANETPSSSNNQ